MLHNLLMHYCIFFTEKVSKKAARGHDESESLEHQPVLGGTEKPVLDANGEITPAESSIQTTEEELSSKPMTQCHDNEEGILMVSN